MVQSFLLVILLMSHVALAESSSISGQVNYPSEILPPLKVCAVNIESSGEVCVETKDEQTAYKIDLPPGKYKVYASLLENRGSRTTSFRAYYTDFVVCGVKQHCKSHEIIEVDLKQGEAKKNINPQDWSRKGKPRY